jgi:hypothetical protein
MSVQASLTCPRRIACTKAGEFRHLRSATEDLLELGLSPRIIGLPVWQAGRRLRALRSGRALSPLVSLTGIFSRTLTEQGTGSLVRGKPHVNQLLEVLDRRIYIPLLGN